MRSLSRARTSQQCGTHLAAELSLATCASGTGAPDDKWDERPKAFVIVRPEHSATADELLEHVRSRIARDKAPREVELVTTLPKTSTGKIQKFELRKKEWSGEQSRESGMNITASTRNARAPQNA